MQNKTKFVFIALFFLTFITTAFAADDEPLLPEVAFKFDAVVKDKHILATWTMADDYYMYHDKSRFESATPGVTPGVADTGDTNLPERQNEAWHIARRQRGQGRDLYAQRHHRYPDRQRQRQ